MAKYKCNYILVRGTGRVQLFGENTGRAGEIRQEKKKKRRYLLEQLQREKHKAAIKYTEKYFQINPPKYVFYGVPMYDKWLTDFPENRKIYIHSFDYDRYLEIKNGTIAEEYIVYIDGGYGNLDEGQVYLNYEDPWYGKGEKLWNKLGTVFDRLEEHYQLPVIVAGHPHTVYPGDKLCNREIIYNKTPELVSKSKFIIMQWSTSVSFALLFHKDIMILIDNDFMKMKHWNQQYATNYGYFHLVPCNMDKLDMMERPWEYVYKIDEKRGQEYFNLFIKLPGTEDRLFIEVVEQKIRELIKKDDEIEKEVRR